IPSLSPLPSFLLLFSSSTLSPSATCRLSLHDALPIFRPAFFKVMRQVVIRISVTVSSNYPNFFAPELFTQSLKHVNLIIDAIYPFVALSVLFNHQISPLGTDNPFHWCLFRERYVTLSRLSVSLDKG